MKRNCKRGISLLLSVCLVLGIFASSGLNLVRAADAEPKVETVVSELNPCTGEHTWVEADCTILKHCSVPGCGATEGEALGHDYSNGDGVCARCQHVCGHTYIDEEGNSTNSICFLCGMGCEHNAPAGYCLICGMELPKNIIANDMFGNGSFETDTSYTIYPITKEWQLGGEGWYIGGNAPEEDMTLAVTNEWSSDGEWAFKIVDSDTEHATSININVPVNADGKEKELYMSADVFAALNDMSFTVTPYVGNYNEGGTKAADAIGPGILKNYKNGETAFATGTIPGNADSLRVSIASKKAIGETDAERVAQVIVDNLVLTIDGGENLLAGMNGSFEELPVGTAPVESAATIPAISYPRGNPTKKLNGWYGLGDLKDAQVAAGCIEEITWELDAEGKATNNAVLHLHDPDATNATSVFYDLYDLEKNTTYILTFRAKKGTDASKANVAQVQQEKYNAETGKWEKNGSDPFASGTDGNISPRLWLTSNEWTTYRLEVRTDAEFDRVRINFFTVSGSVGDYWFDDISLTKVCDHKWENPVVTNENCAFAGKRTVTCACGAIGETEIAPCTGEHVWVEADCTILKHCSVPGCGATEGEALGHDWTNGDGICARCEKACGHTYVDEEGNSTNGICFLCGKGCEHTYAEEAVITEATCTDTGVKTIYCPDCDYSATEEIAALGHNFIDNVCQVCGVCCTHEHGETISTTNPTYTSMGEKVSICAVCGEHFTETIPAKFYGTSVNLGNTLDMYFGFYTGLVDEGGKVVFVREFADGTTETTEAPITSFKKNNSVYDITYTGLAAKEMCDTIHVSVYNSEGTLVGQHSDSIRSYILRQLREKDYGPEFRTLCIDLLNYGAAAQIEFGYNADDLANKDLTAEELAEGTQVVGAYTDKQTIDGNATSYYGTAYILETQISMLMAVRADRIGADCYALVSYIDHTGTEKSNIRVEGKKNYSVYEFCLNEIVVADGRCLLTIEFYKADGTKVLTVQDSMESYTARNAVDYPLAEKMLAFSDSAYNYLHRNDQ